MNNIFSGLSVGLRALETQRKSLDITGHNIANANNENYNKQRAVHKASYPYTAPGLSNHGGAGQFGTGVEMAQVERVKDQFINSQIFNETQTSGYWEEMERGLEKIEYILNEPSDSGIDTAINEFWNSLQDLSNNPGDNAARNMVRENAYTLIDSFQSVDSQLLDYKESINDNLSNAVTDINQISTRIADLNKQIISVKGSGQDPNDLMDERDGLYKDLNGMINVQSREDAQGNLIISTEGMQLVNGSDSYDLEVIPGEPGEYNNSIVHSRTGTEINPKNGKVAAWTEVRDEKLNFYREKLDTLAAGIVNQFNERHQKGYDVDGEPGQEFFQDIPEDRDQSAVALMKLSNTISKANGLDKIAAGSFSGNPTTLEVEKTDATATGNYTVDIVEDGDQFNVKIYELGNDALIAEGDFDKGESFGFNGTDFVAEDAGQFNLTANDTGSVDIGLTSFVGSGDNAGHLADLFDQSDVLEGTSVEGFFRTIVTSVGAESSRSQEMKNNQDVVLKQLNTLDRSVSGVSLDEEMANLIKYQQSYAAAAKYINKTDELLQTLMTIV